MQASAASVNSSQNISATPYRTLLEVYQTQEKWELRYPFAFYSTSNREFLQRHLQRHPNATRKVKNIPTQKRKNKKSKIY